MTTHKAIVMFVPYNAKGNELPDHQLIEWEGGGRDLARAAALTRNIPSSWEIADILFECNCYHSVPFAARMYDFCIGRERECDLPTMTLPLSPR